MNTSTATTTAVYASQHQPDVSRRHRPSRRTNLYHATATLFASVYVLDVPTPFAPFRDRTFYSATAAAR